MVGSASDALDGSGLEHWFFGGSGPSTCGWAGSLDRTRTSTCWSGDVTRNASTRCSRGPPGSTRRLQRPWLALMTQPAATSCSSRFVVSGADGGVVVPVPEQPIVVSSGPLAFARRNLGDVSVRVLTWEMMLAIKGTPRPDEVGGGKDRAALRSSAQWPIRSHSPVPFRSRRQHEADQSARLPLRQTRDWCTPASRNHPSQRQGSPIVGRVLVSYVGATYRN
jgi:hypothetical protein